MPVVGTHIAAVVDRARARLAALLRRPRAQGVRQPAGKRRIDGQEAAAWQEAAREAFRVGTTLEGHTPVAPSTTGSTASTVPASTSVGSTPQWVPASTASAATSRVAQASTPRVSVAAPEIKPAPASAPAERPARRLVSDTAPEFMLQAPTSVIPVADAFFDDLIRRVEGDR